uniref:Histone H2A n=1 Tax=Neovison vison TaxID=452646 RepID=A0A8C7AIT9_NEOVI
MAGGKAGKDSGKATTKAVSHSKRASLQFPVGRVHRHLKLGQPVMDVWARLLLCTVQPSWSRRTTEVLELAGNASKDLKLAIGGDQELGSFIKAAVAGGGVIPHIHKCEERTKKDCFKDR